MSLVNPFSRPGELYLLSGLNRNQMPAPETTREDIIRLLENNGFGFVVDGKRVDASPQEQLNQALELACECGFLDLARKLHERGAQIEGNTEPLKAAAENNRLDVARYLIAKGADLNGRSQEQGQTPLMDAAVSASIDVFTYLLDAGADVNLTASDGSSALDWARSGRHSAGIPELRFRSDAITDYDQIIETLTNQQNAR